MKLNYAINDVQSRAALDKAPEVMGRNLEAALDRAAIEGADMMRAEISQHDVTGALKNSVAVRRFAALERFITPTLNTAAAVDEGTGPAAGKARYFPNPDNLLDFIRHSPASRGFGWARKGSSKRGGQDLELWFRSRAMARSIYMKGTQPANFVAKTEAQSKERFFALMDEGVAMGVREVMA
jgi:hypothetical protein